MSETPNDAKKTNGILRLWRFLRRPSTSVSLLVLLVAGFVAGVVFLGSFNWVIAQTNTEAFCTSCHEMRDNPYEQMKDSIHFVNRTGVKAICSDCHVPHNWFLKVGRKIVATQELFLHIAGKLDTPEEFQQHHLSLAVSVWEGMKETDSRECRECHTEVWTDMSAQFGSARRNHEFAIENNLTCIDCHQGIAHDLPKSFVQPTNDALAQDAREWLAKMQALAAEQPQD